MQVGLPKYKHNDITSSLHTIGYDGFSAHIRSEEYLWFKQDAHKVNLLAAWESGWVQSTYDVSVGFAFNNNDITVSLDWWARSPFPVYGWQKRWLYVFTLGGSRKPGDWFYEVSWLEEEERPGFGFANDITVSLRRWLRTAGYMYSTWYDEVRTGGAVDDWSGRSDAYVSRGFANPPAYARPDAVSNPLPSPA